MSEPLDELYFRWLYRQVCSVKVRTPARTYWKLLRELFTTEFIFFVPHDGNRAEDGKALREEFLAEKDLTPEEDWIQMGCSILEMLIALARRLDFETDRAARLWFWELLQNLDLADISDNKTTDKEYIAEVLERVNNRLYSRDGSGGLFPLRHARKDQRRQEIWAQLYAYIQE